MCGVCVCVAFGGSCQLPLHCPSARGWKWSACIDDALVECLAPCAGLLLVPHVGCGQVGKAQHIQFDPLRAHPVTIPEGGVCVVANSLVEASKVRTHTPSGARASTG